MRFQILLLPALYMGLLAQTAGAAASAPEAPVAPSKAAAAAPKGPEANLKIAMPADAVIKIMGKPANVKPMKAQSGKAEVWVYLRQVGDRVEYVQLTTPIMSPVPDGNGTTRMVETGVKVDNHAQHHITTEVVELLMFNDHFVTQTASQVESLKIY